MAQNHKQLSLPLFPSSTVFSEIDAICQSYETDGLCATDERIILEKTYANLIEPTNRFSRQTVSFQANKNLPIHRWVKYKEAYSARLVELLLDDLELKQGQTLFDPFAGVGTSLLVASQEGIHARGVELLKSSHLIWEAKANFSDYSSSKLKEILSWLETSEPMLSEKTFPHIPITETAFPREEESILMWYQEQFSKFDLDKQHQNLLTMMLLAILEDVSYTRKDGQYLRWDSRSKKAQERDAKRLAQGKKPYKAFHKGKLLSIKQALLNIFRIVVEDIGTLQDKRKSYGNQSVHLGSVLDYLPSIESEQFDAVMTSPPYCNRYDYTRTYALELAFLGYSHEEVVQLRQTQLSCTVENRSKMDYLKTVYSKLNRLEDYKKVKAILESHPALIEINKALEIRMDMGMLNNAGIVQMVKGYFIELGFVIYELFRVSKAGAKIAFVNDNVRYGGEIIPVDLLLMDIASKVGFEPIKIYSLNQKKGNSSQQMARYGREAMRKSIILWQKPS